MLNAPVLLFPGFPEEVKMHKFIKPTIFVSRCLEFDHCRYNGQIISSAVVARLKNHVNIIHHCPEVEIGLGIPRKSLRLIKKGNDIYLMQSQTEIEYTDKMKKYADNVLEELQHVNGFILKGRSPSCGYKDVKIYPKMEKVPALNSKAVGIFAAKVKAKYPNLPLEDEGRFTNLKIREHFFTQIYLYAEFNSLQIKMKALIDFHARNKYLFMAYNQEKLKTAGRIVANHKKLDTEEVFKLYRKELYKIMNQMPRYTSHINVMMHLMGYFSDKITKSEKEYFLKQIDLYRADKIPLIAVTNIIKSWIIRFDMKYLENQNYFNPYLPALVSLKDSGKGRMK